MTTRSRPWPRSRRHPERGQALVEFALVALVLYMLLAVTVEFGRLIFSAQALQDATRLGAREIALTPLPAELGSLDAAMTYVDPSTGLAPIPTRIYDDHFLVVDEGVADAMFPGDPDALDRYFATFPLLNQMLRPVMVFETINGRNLVHFPGTVVVKTIGGTSYETVLIPLVQTVPAPPLPNGMTPFVYDAARVTWLQVVEEVRSDPADPGTSWFPASGPSVGPPGPGGYVRLRINYPFQSAMLSAYEIPQPPVLPPAPNGSSPVLANDAAFDGLTPNVSGSGVTFTYLKADDPNETGAYAGPAGLGRQLALAQTLRPFRKVLAAQAVFRREVFQ